MAKSSQLPASHGPFLASQIHPGDPYELSNGHAIRCLPTGGRGSDANAVGAAVLKSDPEVDSAGVDTGYSPAPDTLRAPDVAVGNVPKEPGWVRGAPPLAVEYADTGQDEGDLATKIHELLAAGTRHIWVVRLTGPRRVEVHEPGQPKRIARPGDELRAPGILKNPVPVEALYDWELGQEVTLRNLLQRRGYADLEAVLARGKAEGRAEGEAQALRDAILEVFATRGFTVETDVHATLANCRDTELLKRWLRLAVTASSAAEMLNALSSPE